MEIIFKLTERGQIKQNYKEENKKKIYKTQLMKYIQRVFVLKYSKNL